MQEEDKNLSAEELGKKLDKLLKQSEEQLQKLNGSAKELRAHVFGQDRYWRRYWELPCSGGVYVEAMESAEPEVLDLQAELDEKYKNMKVEDKVDPKKEEKDGENRENETPNEVKEEIKPNSPDKNDEKVEENNHASGKKELSNCVSDEPKNSVPELENDAKKQGGEETKMEVDVKTEEIKKEENGTDEDIVKLEVKAEDKSSEAVANGDKFSHINNLHNSKEVNGNFLPGKFTLS